MASAEPSFFCFGSVCGHDADAADAASGAASRYHAPPACSRGFDALQTPRRRRWRRGASLRSTEGAAPLPLARTQSQTSEHSLTVGPVNWMALMDSLRYSLSYSPFFCTLCLPLFLSSLVAAAHSLRPFPSSPRHSARRCSSLPRIPSCICSSRIARALSRLAPSKRLYSCVKSACLVLSSLSLDLAITSLVPSSVPSLRTAHPTHSCMHRSCLSTMCGLISNLDGMPQRHPAARATSKLWTLSRRKNTQPRFILHPPASH